jgi:hypothetical protein
MDDVKTSMGSFFIVPMANRPTGTTSPYSTEDHHLLYVGRTYCTTAEGALRRWSMKNDEKFAPTKPANIDEKATATDKRMWKKEIDEYVRWNAKLSINCEKLYSRILGQCTYYLLTKIESLDEFKGVERNFYVIKLMKTKSM